MNYPEYFLKTIGATFGEEGQRWLRQIPEIIASLERSWSIQVEPPFPGLSYNYAAPAYRADGTELVLKFGIPREEINREIEALRTYDGRGSVQLVASNPDQGALLLERLVPGQMLAELCPERDAQATIISAAVMERLWQPLPANHEFLPIASWFDGFRALREKFDGDCGPFPQRLVEAAESLYVDLSVATDEPALLHGDLHHYNILSDNREPWLAIDPKGVFGDRAFDVGALLRNPLDFPRWDSMNQVLERRVHILAERLNLDRQRVIGWGIAVNLLSSWWSYEDNDSQWWAVLPVVEYLVQLMDQSG
jgi:streptomycin 6-kinase